VGLEEYLAIRSKLIRKLKRDDGLPWADASFNGFHHVQAVAIFHDSPSQMPS
jgi:hypothetical protein